jgi:hypothetical protein
MAATQGDVDFAALYENHWSKSVFAATAAFTVVVGVPVYASIIGFERLGSDKKRTLINQVPGACP